MVLRALHLCSGYGGFELALGGIARTVAHVERDAYAAAVLVARMEEAELDQAPIWSDLTTFDGEPWRGRVDLITAGFPCQPFSSAGQQRGLDDDRWLWPDIERIIGEVRPRFVFLENVRGVVGAGLPAVLHSLAVLGFDAEWGMLAASDVGAPHRRERFWLVARVVGDSSGSGLPRGRSRGEGTEYARSPIDGRGVGDPDCARRQGQNVTVAARLERGRAWEDVDGHRFPPRPGDAAGWATWDGPQPVVRRGTYGTFSELADPLHLGGNGLVPQAARYAWQLLNERFEKDL